jgi:hypothetical protein
MDRGLIEDYKRIARKFPQEHRKIYMRPCGEFTEVAITDKANLLYGYVPKSPEDPSAPGFFQLGHNSKTDQKTFEESEYLWNMIDPYIRRTIFAPTTQTLKLTNDLKSAIYRAQKTRMSAAVIDPNGFFAGNDDGDAYAEDIKTSLHERYFTVTRVLDMAVRCGYDSLAIVVDVPDVDGLLFGEHENSLMFAVAGNRKSPFIDMKAAMAYADEIAAESKPETDWKAKGKGKKLYYYRETADGIEVLSPDRYAEIAA